MGTLFFRPVVMASLRSRCGHYIFALWFLLSFFFFSSPNLSKTLSAYVFATKACINNLKKLVNQQYLPTCSRNMVNFGSLTADIHSGVWGTPANFDGFRVLAALRARHSSGRQPYFVALNRRRHLYSTGRPSRWALAHILVRLSF